MKTFDLTKMPKRTENSICYDFDDTCNSNTKPLQCWLKSPTCGICPLLTENGND